jgi:hypothetical protein
MRQPKEEKLQPRVIKTLTTKPRIYQKDEPLTVTLREILQFKAMKDLFEKLHHSERTSIITMYTKMNYDDAYKLTPIRQGKLLFQLLYTAKDPEEIRRKIHDYLEARKE